jgi:cytochrome c oxidase cbb3-type subunit 3
MRVSRSRALRLGMQIPPALLLSLSIGTSLFGQAPANPGSVTPQPAGPAPAAPRPRGASERPPQTVTPQAYPQEQVKAGQPLFLARCGFCHGPDAAGGETGPDLTRSTLVAEDVRGAKVIPLVREGRIDKGMPAFNLADTDLAAIVAFIHDRKTTAESQEGTRRSVEIADLQTGDAEAGKQYFNGAGRCAGCHSPTGDLAGVAKRLEGLALLQRMLNPGGGQDSRRAAAAVTVTLGSGQTVTGKLAYRDEFTIALTDEAGAYHSWPAKEVTYSVKNPLDAHIDQLEKYTDDDMHNVLAYLQTLR